MRRMASRSCGLSSMKTKLSRPRLSSSAMLRTLCGFGSQLMRVATKSSSFSSIPGCVLNAVMASGLFLLRSGKQHALALQAQAFVLEGFERIAGKLVVATKLGDAVLAEDAAPQRVVHIEREHFCRPLLDGAIGAGEGCRQGPAGRRRNRACGRSTRASGRSSVAARWPESARLLSMSRTCGWLRAISARRRLTRSMACAVPPG